MATHVLSPGYCPMGYTSADITISGPTTTATCCPSNHKYYKTTVNGNNLTPAPLVGCLSSMASTITTRVPLAIPGSEKDTLVSGPLTMWAQPIMVMLQSIDLSLYGAVSTSSSATPTPTVSAPQPTSTYYEDNSPTFLAPYPTPITTAIPSTLMTLTISTELTEPTTSIESTTPDPAEATTLSPSAKAGISIGAAGLGLAVFVIVIVSRIFHRRKRLQSSSSPQATVQERGSFRSFKPRAKAKEVRRGPPAELEA